MPRICARYFFARLALSRCRAACACCPVFMALRASATEESRVFSSDCCRAFTSRMLASKVSPAREQVSRFSSSLDRPSNRIRANHIVLTDS
eukprot:3938889-Rhodomonas_salina.2